MNQHSPAAEVFIICAKSKMKFNPLGNAIMDECQLGFSHFAIAIRYKGQLVVSEAVWPRPRFIEWNDWIKGHEPVFMFRKEIKNQLMLFEMMNWMAILCTKSWYSVLQLLLIYIRLRVKMLKRWAGAVILNGESGLVCCEYVTLFLNKFFAEELPSTADSMGMREPFDALTARWVLLGPEQMAYFMVVHG